MKNKSLLSIFLIIVFSFLMYGNKLIKAPDSLKGLNSSYKWAAKNAKNDKYIVYTVKVLMNENSHYGSWYSDSEDMTNLGELLTGKKHLYRNSGKMTVKNAAKMALKSHKAGDRHRSIGKKVLKNVAILFKFEKKRLSKISTRTYDSMIEEKNYQIYWLGDYNNNESITFLKKQFVLLKEPKLQKQLVSSIALHKDEKNVKPFLLNIVKNNYDDKVKANAIFWLGEYSSPEIVKILIKIAKGNNSKLGKKAVFSLYRIKDNKADNALIDLAKNSKNRKIRKNAIFWLGQKAIKKSSKILGDIAKNDSDFDVQKKAVFALSQLPGDSGIDKLVNIAKTHKSFKLRKSALFWLGQSNNPKGLKTIIDILKD